jgi:hypothetical protein
MLWHRTRLLGLSLAVVFHLSNSLIFNIQIFPWLALTATLLFLPPSWPRLGGQWRRLSESSTVQAASRLSAGQTALFAMLGVYFLVQVLMPLRHFAFSGNAEWTHAGEFHAWRMLLAETKGDIAFFVTSDDPPAICEVDNFAYLYPLQAGYLNRPDAMVQFARYLEEQYSARGAANFEIHVWTNYQLNGRDARGLIDPDVDLLSVSRPLGKPSWVIDLEDAVPLEKPEAERCPDPSPLQRVRQLETLLPQ